MSKDTFNDSAFNHFPQNQIPEEGQEANKSKLPPVPDIIPEISRKTGRLLKDPDA